MSLFKCKGCEAKDKEIIRIKSEGCPACGGNAQTISWLKEQNANLQADLKVERSEKKRLLDRLLEINRVAPISQEANTPNTMNYSDLMSIFNEPESK